MGGDQNEREQNRFYRPRRTKCCRRAACFCSVFQQCAGDGCFADHRGVLVKQGARLSDALTVSLISATFLICAWARSCRVSERGFGARLPFIMVPGGASDRDLSGHRPADDVQTAVGA